MTPAQGSSLQAVTCDAEEALWHPQAMRAGCCSWCMLQHWVFYWGVGKGALQGQGGAAIRMCRHLAGPLHHQGRPLLAPGRQRRAQHGQLPAQLLCIFR